MMICTLPEKFSEQSLMELELELPQFTGHFDLL
jgi:hypothetical protein